MDGTISRLLKDKGFGFIRLVGGGEFFFHKDDVAPGCNFDVLDEGDNVTFEEVTPRPTKGARATKVQAK